MSRTSVKSRRVSGRAARRRAPGRRPRPGPAANCLREVGDRVDRLLARAGVVERAGVDHPQAVGVGVEAGDQRRRRLGDRVRVLRAQRRVLGRRDGLGRPVLLARADRERPPRRAPRARTASSTLAVIATLWASTPSGSSHESPRAPARRGGRRRPGARRRTSARTTAGSRRSADGGRRRGDDLVARGLAGGDEVATGEPGRPSDEDAQSRPDDRVGGGDGRLS